METRCYFLVVDWQGGLDTRMRMEPPVLARGGLRLLQHVSYGSEPVGSMPLSYEFSMPYLETIEDEDGEIITEDGHRRCILGTDTTEQHTLELSYTTRSRRYPTKSPAG